MQLVAVSDAPMLELTEQEIGDVNGGVVIAPAVAAVATLGAGIAVGAGLVLLGYWAYHHFN